MIRQVLRSKLEEEHQKKLQDELQKLTEKEIKEELSLMKDTKEAQESWMSYCTNGKIPESIQLKYQDILKNVKVFEGGRVDSKLEKAMVVLILFREFLGSIGVYKTGWYESDVVSRRFVITSLRYQENRALWRAVNEILEVIEALLPRYEKFPQIFNRLIERLSEIPDQKVDLETHKKLCQPLAEILKVEPLPSILKTRVLYYLSEKRWHREIYEIVTEVKDRLESMRRSLPDPNKIECAQAIDFVLKCYDTISGEEGFVPAKTLEEATILDHIAFCYDECFLVKDCVDTLFHFGVIKGVLTDYPVLGGGSIHTDEIIKKAKAVFRKTNRK